MAIIRQVQRGNVTKPAGSATVTVTIPQTLLDMSKSILLFSMQTASTSNPARDGLLTGELISTTQITFRDNSGGTNPAVYIEWQIIEYFEGVNVQRGTVTNVQNGGVNVAISAITVAKSWVIISARANAGHIGNQSLCRATITSPTNLQLYIQNNNVATVHWQVVQYDNCNVQTIQQTVTSNTTTTDVAISSVDPETTVLFASFYTATGTLLAYYWPVYRLLNSTTVRFQIQATGWAQMLYTLQVVEFDPGEARVQRFLQSISSSDLEINIALSELNPACSVSMIKGMYDTHGVMSYLSELNNRVAFETNIISSSQTYIQRASSGSSGLVSVEVWEKPAMLHGWHLRGCDRGIGLRMH